MQIKIFSKIEQKQNPNFLDGVLVPDQPHLANIIEIVNGKEDLSQIDGIFTSRKNNFKLAIKTADCSAIVFYDKKNYGIVHAGWRGLVLGIVEKMMKKFENPEIFVAPFLKKFEIQKDFCYDMIFEKFGDKFFEKESRDVALLHLYSEENKIIFNFESALKSVLGEKAVFDERDTLKDSDFYSYRRDKTEKRNYIMVENIKN